MSRFRRSDAAATASGARRRESVAITQIAAPSLVHLYNRLAAEGTLGDYRRAFEQATGMPLWLEPASQEGVGAPMGSAECPSDKINPFCRKIFWTDDPCQSCVDAHSMLAAAPGEKASTIQCFAGLQVTAVPVWLGTQVLGYLRTGQVFSDGARADDFGHVCHLLRKDPGFRERDLESLRPLFLEAPTVERDRYAALIQLLVFFAEQLSALAERLLHAGRPDQPEAVKKACAHMRHHFDREVTLEELSRAAGVSAHHLCAVFKEATGVTMIEYLNRERILQAKKRLLSRYARVSEVALDVGFGSLSQFNRCFARFAGESPTEFRRRALAPIREVAA